MPLSHLACTSLWLAIMVSSAAASDAIPLFERGHLKGQWLSASYPDDSLSACFSSMSISGSRSYPMAIRSDWLTSISCATNRQS